MSKEKVGEYEEFVHHNFEFKEEDQKKEYETYVKQELFNFKVERVVGIEQEKEEFDEVYKESIVEYLNANSYKNKSNTGTIIGRKQNN